MPQRRQFYPDSSTRFTLDLRSIHPQSGAGWGRPTSRHHSRIDGRTKEGCSRRGCGRRRLGRPIHEHEDGASERARTHAPLAKIVTSVTSQTTSGRDGPADETEEE